MHSDDNSVNIKRRSRSYHHGDLRSALIEAGLAWLASGQGDIGLREIARLVGVSATAVYRHFPDKQALIAALCQRGEAQLASAQRSAAEAAGGGVAGFGAAGEAYVRFALANPGLFRLMMSVRPAVDAGPHLRPDALPDVLEDGGEAMRGFRQDIAAALPGSADLHQRMAAIHAWSLVHGMAMLMLDGMIPADEMLIKSISMPQFGETPGTPMRAGENVRAGEKL